MSAQVIPVSEGVPQHADEASELHNHLMMMKLLNSSQSRIQ